MLFVDEELRIGEFGFCTDFGAVTGHISMLFMNSSMRVLTGRLLLQTSEPFITVVGIGYWFLGMLCKIGSSFMCSAA